MNNQKEDLLLDKLRYRMENTGIRFLPQTLFKLSNYVKFSSVESYQIIVQRILVLKFLGYIRFNCKLGLEYQVENIKKLDCFDLEKFLWNYEQVFLDGEYVLQMFKESKIDLRGTDFTNLFNLVSTHLKRDREYVLDVACYIYIYQRVEVPLEKKGSE